VKKSIKQIMFLLLGLILLGGTLVCSGAEEEYFVIGISAPFSGTNAVRGKLVLDGAKLAMEQINAEGGINGIKIKLVNEDNEGNPTKVVNTVIKLIEQEEVDALLVSDSSGTMAAVPVVTEAKIPMFMTAFSPALTEQGSSFVFRCTVSDGLTGRQAVEYAVDVLGYDKIGIMHSTDSYGKGILEPALEALKELGKSVVGVETFSYTDQDFSSQLLNLNGAGAEAIFVHTYDVPTAIIVKQIDELGLDMKIFGSTALASEEFKEMAGKSREGVKVLVAFINSNPDPIVQEFVSAFEGSFGYKPDANCARAHAAIMLYAEALKAAESTDSAKIVEALHNLENVKLPGGNFTFDEKGEGLKQNMVGEWKDGEMQFLGLYSGK